MPFDVTSVAPIAMHFVAIFAAGATVVLLNSVSGRRLIGVTHEDE